MRSLSERSELRRSWMGGSAATAARARKSALRQGQGAASPPIPTFPRPSAKADLRRLGGRGSMSEYIDCHYAHARADTHQRPYLNGAIAVGTAIVGGGLAGLTIALELA